MQHQKDPTDATSHRRRMNMVPVLATLLLALAILTHSSLSLPQHGDERMYVWKGGYYGSRLARLDFSPGGEEPYLDPGWDPFSFWAVEQPLGSHLVYAATMGITGTSPPEDPFCWGEALFQGDNTAIPPDTLVATRFVAVLCASLGLALISWRFGWVGVAASALFLTIPHVRSDLGRAWAEGPLLLGLGIGAATYGTFWFPFAAGATAALKLTGLALWPVAFFRHPIGRSNLSHIASVGVAWLAWSIASPLSWTLGGPPHLIVLVSHRIQTYMTQSTLNEGWLGEQLAQERVFGLYLPTRYLWPLELGVLLLLCHLAARWIAARKARLP